MENYGRRMDDLMMSDITPEVEATLSNSQKINVKIIQNLTSLNTAINNLQADVRIHDKVLITGNGEPSLQERVRKLETFVESFQFWQRTVAVALVLQTITFGAAAVIYFIKLTPILEKLSH